MTASQKIDQYFSLREELFKLFEYKEDWNAIPLDDDREYFWRLTGEEANDEVQFAKTEEELEEGTGDYYTYEIWATRFLKKWVYRSKKFTMVIADTHTDGNKLLMIFDNSKERP